MRLSVLGPSTTWLPRSAMPAAGATRAAAGLTELQRLDIRRCADVAARRSVVLVVHGVIVMPQHSRLLRKLGQHNLDVQQKTWSTWLQERSNSSTPATDEVHGTCHARRGRSSRQQRSTRRMNDYISAKRQEQQQLAAAELRQQQEQQLEQEQLCWQESWLLFSEQRQQQLDELAALDAAANVEAALHQPILTTTTDGAAATGEQRRPAQPPLERLQHEGQAGQGGPPALDSAAEQAAGSTERRGAAAENGKRQAVGEEAIDLDMVGALPPCIDLTARAPTPAAAAAVRGHSSVRGRARPVAAAVKPPTAARDSHVVGRAAAVAAARQRAPPEPAAAAVAGRVPRKRPAGRPPAGPPAPAKRSFVDCACCHEPAREGAFCGPAGRHCANA